MYTYLKRAVRTAHFNFNRAFKVIQGYPYWCWQKLTTACHRNVQLIPTLFSETYEYIATGKLQIRRFQRHAPRFENAPASNVFEYLEIILIERN